MSFSLKSSSERARPRISSAVATLLSSLSKPESISQNLSISIAGSAKTADSSKCVIRWDFQNGVKCGEYRRDGMPKMYQACLVRIYIFLNFKLDGNNQPTR